MLAQIGTRHLTDPYVLCSEVHCQAYRGTGAETTRTAISHGLRAFGGQPRQIVVGRAAPDQAGTLVFVILFV